MTAKTERAMALGTLAIAISSFMQGILLFQEFRNNMVLDWINWGALVALGIMLLLCCSVTFAAITLLWSPKKIKGK